MSKPNPPCDLVAGPFPVARGLKTRAFFDALEGCGFPPVHRWAAGSVRDGQVFGILLETVLGWEIKIFSALETYSPTGAVAVAPRGSRPTHPPPPDAPCAAVSPGSTTPRQRARATAHPEPPPRDHCSNDDGIGPKPRPQL